LTQSGRRGLDVTRGMTLGRSLLSAAARDIRRPRVEAFYWVTILASNTPGTALGDFLTDSSGLGYRRGALVFAGALVVVALLRRFRVA